MKLYNKIITGYVIQSFDENGEFVEQDFISGEVDWEDGEGNSISDDEVPDSVFDSNIPIILISQDETHNPYYD